jgi:hypothetical protein
MPASSPQRSPDDLLQNGPPFPRTLRDGSFDVDGFARGGWPFVIDFQPQPESCTWLEVSADDAPAWGAILDPDGRAGRRTARITLPENLGQLPRPAHYAVYSVQQPCTVRQPTPTPSRIDVYGIGAGPRAVGSVAINNLQFGPRTPRFPQEMATFVYVADNDFGRVSQEILDFRPDGAAKWIVVPVSTTQLYASQRGTHRGSWDGTGPGGGRTPGIYRFQVRAWNTLNDEKSWAGAISSDSVHIARP